MKKILFSRIYSALLCSMLVAFVLTACKDEDDVGVPVITAIRNYAASPDDTVVQTIQAGQWVVVMGNNLRDVSLVLFGSVPATINYTYSTDQSIVIQVPSIPFPSVPKDKLNVVTVANSSGTATFEINVTGAPMVSHIRNNAASPDGAIVDAIFPDQQINIVGYNLKGATQITFQGVEADLSSVVYTDSSAIVQVPSDFSNADITLANMINYTTPLGTAAFHIGIIGPPLVTNISCENPSEGSTVYIQGYNFVSIDSLKFGGTLISDFEASSDGSTLKFVVPNLTKNGPFMVATPGGKFKTIFNVNDVTTGALCNFDDISPIGWGGSGATVSDNSTDFPGNTGKYAILQNDVVAPWDWQAWNGGRIIILDKVKWMPATNEADGLDSWAVKFELNVPAGWNGNSLFVSSENNDYKITYEPWKDATGKTFKFKTEGWQTITLPFSLFRKGWGGTVPPTDLKDLLGNTESCGFAIQTMNISSSNSATGLKAAVDNIRVVKIK